MSVRNTNAPKRSRLSAALIAAMVVPFAGTALAQEAASSSSTTQSGATTLDKVSVTGSRIKRAEIEGPSPVTVITAADIEREGFTTVADALQSLTQATTFGFSGDMVQNGFTPNAQIINLRGFGPGYTLVLIDGRRMPEYPQPYNSTDNFVNVAAIPSGIVERIEVLTGGASAIYGSDAVAGVVNIITKKNFDGNKLDLTVGTSTRGGGDLGKLQWTGGKTGDNWNVIYGLETFNQEPIYGTQRDFLDSNLDSPASPTPAPSLALAAIGLRSGTGLDNGQLVYFPGQATCDNFGFEVFTSPTRGLMCGPRDTDAQKTIQNKTESLSGYFRGQFDFDNGVQLWASFSGFDTSATSSSGVEFWGTSGNRYSGASIAIPALKSSTASNGYNLVQLQRIFTADEIGGPGAAVTKFDEKQFLYAAGINGSMFDNRFVWDFTLSHATYEYRADRPRLLAQKVHEYFLGSTTPVGYTRIGTAATLYPIFNLNVDRFFHQKITPEIYRSLTTRVVNEGDSSSSQATFSLTGDLFELPAGSLGVAAVLEWASQEYDLNADPRILPSYTGPEYIYNLTGTGGGGERDRYAFGLEFSVPILDSLTAQLAGRYDKYDDITNVDDAITYNFGLEWRPVDSLLLRGSYATSFRAPGMHYVFAEQSGSFASILDEYACRSGNGLGLTTGPRTYSQCNAATNDRTKYSSFGIREGNPALEEEEGKSWTVGVVWDVIDNMSMTVDYYDIQLENQVGDISSAYILQNEANCRLGVNRDGTPFGLGIDSAFCQEMLSRVTRTSAPGTTNDMAVTQIVRGPRNRAQLGTKGIDATWRYRLDTDRYGDFNFHLSWTHTLEQTYAEFADEPVRDLRDQLNNYEHRSKVRGAISWERDDWTATIYGQRWGSTPNWAETGRLGPYMKYNLTVGKKITNDLKLTLAIDNVLDNIAKDDPTHTSWPYFNPYLYSPVGRQVYVQAEYRF